MKSPSMHVVVGFALGLAAISPLTSCRKPSQAVANDLGKSGYSLGPDDWFRSGEANEVEVLKKFVASGFDINTKNPAGDTLLHTASAAGAQGTVEYLLDKRMAVDLPGTNGRTPLMHASSAGRKEMTAWLLRQGADPRAKDTDGYTALMLAVREGKPGPVEELAAYNRDDLDSALLLAALTGQDATIDTLTNYGASVYARMEDGRTPLMLAAQNGHTGAVKLLLDIGSSRFSTDQEGRTAADLASAAGHMEVAELINHPNETVSDAESSLSLNDPVSFPGISQGTEQDAGAAETPALRPESIDGASISIADAPATSEPAATSDGSGATAARQTERSLAEDSSLALQESRRAPSPALIMRGYKQSELPVRVKSVAGNIATLQLGNVEGSREIEVSAGQNIPGSQLTIIRVSSRTERSKMNFGQPTDVAIVEVRDAVSGRHREWASGTTASAYDPVALVEDASTGRRYTATVGQKFTAANGDTHIVTDVRPNQIVIENTTTGEAHTIPLRGPKG